MSLVVKPIPDGYRTVTPHLVCRDANAAIAFYQEALGAELIHSMPGPDGKVMHAEIRLGDSVLFLGEECPDWGVKSPLSLGGSGVTIHIYVEDADAAFARAVEAGATVTMPLMDAFWGDRYGKLADPFGHNWSIATHKEDLTPQEMAERGAAAMAAVA